MQGIKALRLLTRNANNMVVSRHYGKGRKFPFPTMNDMPVPEGDFFAEHARRNRKYNTILATGVTLFSSAIYMLATGDIIHFNWSPPDSIE